MKYTNKHKLPKVFEDIVKKLTYDITTRDPKRVGVTTLTNPPRIKILTVRHWSKLEEDISNHIWRILGNAIHWVMGKGESSHRLVEEKLEEKIDDITLVGRLDTYDSEEKSLSDYKITSIWSIKFETKEEWINQLNVYAWLLRKANFEVNSLYINAILKDWRRGESLKYREYPSIPYQKVEIPLWSFEKQEVYIKGRIKMYKEALLLEDGALPICTTKERWRKETEYAVYKNKNKTATKLLDTLDLAKLYMNGLPKGKDLYRIEKRESKDLRCTDYCLCNKFCSYWKETYGK